MNFSTAHHPLLAVLARLETELATLADSELPYAITAEPWADAGAFITEDALVWANGQRTDHAEIGVLTRHARPLSWLFFTLGEQCRRVLHVGNRDTFFGRLADAANAHLAAQQPESSDWRPLLTAVIHEAARFLEDSQRSPKSRSRRGRTVEIPMVLELTFA